MKGESDAWKPKPADSPGNAVKDEIHAGNVNDNGQAAYERRISDAWRNAPRGA